MSGGAVPGWHGKLPSLGDFASRRLEPALVARWDAWLAEGLDGLRQAAPASWLDDYLAAPTWRFLLLPGVLDQRCWAGVLMPSVDRVGRYFPFAILQSLAPPPARVEPLLRWLHQLDDLAADALQEDWEPERLDAALAQLAPPDQPEVPGLPPLPPPEGVEIRLAGTSDLMERLALAGAAAWLQAAQGQAVWFADAQGQGQPRLLRTAGLPRGPGFGRLFTPATAT